MSQREADGLSTDAADYTRAVLNILEDFNEERERFSATQRALFNILDDFGDEKRRLDDTQKAVLNILDDFSDEKLKAEAANLVLSREVRERRQAESALLQKTTELARSNAELEQFAYVASHDLQEPLRMVSSYVQLFERRYRGQVDEQADKYIHYAVEGARRMQLLIGGLLEYSRVGTQEAPLGQVSCELALEQALTNLRVAIEESKTVVTYSSLPDVMADDAQLVQLLQNLISNAVKFARPGVAPRVHVSAVAEGDRVRIDIADNGIGIAAEHGERVFVIFQRLHTRAEYPGTGIGLAICKKVVERHGGKIWFESEPDRGTTFRFTLPLQGTPP